ncbi:uncharacterized protein LOC116345437 [Contarinia nasturtii]|uniref:uncharacterized protein LOC116345437 n=1 Tax=Contarinia nasturtii TaxID=265458 RepID=UPI0012D41742|nr:uncharacterized protein LOC116345437 [Contarinia nasturtii]
MCLQHLFYVLFGFVVLVIARKRDDWPSASLENSFDEEAVCKLCYKKCPGSTRDEVELFEKTTDLENLPNSYPLKCFMHCVMEEAGALHRNAAQLNYAHVMQEIDKLQKDHQKIVIAMGKGCIKRVRDITDPVEFAYALNVCCKKNDNDHYYFIY